MPRYLVYCPKCSYRMFIMRPMSEASDMTFCADCGSVMDRIFTAPRVIIPQASAQENDVLGVIARSSSEQDKRAIQEKYIAQNDAESDDLVDEKLPVSMDTILSSGIVQAAQSGKHAVEAWRRDWVRPELEGIADSG